MKKIWLTITASLFLTACGAGGIVPAGLTATEVKPKIGETALYQSQREGLTEGVIENIDGTRYKIKYGTSVATAEESDVYPLPKAGAKPNVKAGDMVAAKISSGSYWAGAEVVSVNGDVIEVKDLFYGNAVSLSPDKIVVVRAPAVAGLQKFKSEKDFSTKAKQAKPSPPAGYKPKVGDHIVGEWSAGAWWVGDVTEVAGEKAKVKWESFPVTEMTFDKIIPYPKAETATQMPVANSYVLVKPAGGSGQWFHAQVTSVNGNSAEVKFADGKTRPIKADEYIALN